MEIAWRVAKGLEANGLLCSVKRVLGEPQTLAKWHSLYSGTGASRPVHCPRFPEEPGGSRRLRYKSNTK